MHENLILRFGPRGPPCPLKVDKNLAMYSLNCIHGTVQVDKNVNQICLLGWTLYILAAAISLLKTFLNLCITLIDIIKTPIKHLKVAGR